MRWYDEALAPLGDSRMERDVPTHAGQTHVVIAGPARGEPLVLVHGSGASAAVLRDEIADYARVGFRVYAPDIPGHMGKSEPRELALTDESHGRWLVEVMEGLGLERASFIGYSLGGLVVLKLGEHAPERIQRAVIAVPAGLSRPTVLRALPLLLDVTMYAITSNARWRERMVTRLFAPGTTPDPHLFESINLSVQHLLPDRRSYPVLTAAGLGRLRVPVLVLAGEHDPLFDWRATVAGAKARLPDVTAEKLAGCGHVFDVEHRARFRTRTLEFLRPAKAERAPSAPLQAAG